MLVLSGIQSAALGPLSHLTGMTALKARPDVSIEAMGLTARESLAAVLGWKGTQVGLEPRTVRRLCSEALCCRPPTAYFPVLRAVTPADC